MAGSSGDFFSAVLVVTSGGWGVDSFATLAGVAVSPIGAAGAVAAVAVSVLAAAGSSAGFVIGGCGWAAGDPDRSSDNEA